MLVAHLAKVLTLGGDRVEAVETIAHELGRGAFDVVCRLQHMTNSSLKLTAGLIDEADEEAAASAAAAAECSARGADDAATAGR